MSSNLLLIKAAPDIADEEVNQVKAIAEHFELKVQLRDLTNIADLTTELCRLGEQYEFIYLAAHADTSGFGDRDGNDSHDWADLAVCICDSRCTTSGTVLFLGCCRGGLKKVATQVFCACMDIDYICGPRWTVRPEDITTGFHVFLYNLLIRSEQPSVAVERASKATNYDFFCHDRIELEDEIEKACAAMNGDQDVHAEASDD